MPACQPAMIFSAIAARSASPIRDAVGPILLRHGVSHRRAGLAPVMPCRARQPDQRQRLTLRPARAGQLGDECVFGVEESVGIVRRRGGVGLLFAHRVQEPDSFSQRLVGLLELTQPGLADGPARPRRGLLRPHAPWPTPSVSPGESSCHYLLAESGRGRGHRRTPSPATVGTAMRHPPSSKPRPLLPIRQQLILDDELTNLRGVNPGLIDTTQPLHTGTELISQPAWQRGTRCVDVTDVVLVWTA